MSHTNITDTARMQTPNGQQSSGTDETQNTSPLASAHVNAKVVTARTPHLVNPPQQATREQVAASLAEIVSRSFTHGSQVQKANSLLNLLPPDMQTPEAWNNLERVLKNESDAVKTQLRRARGYHTDPNRRLRFRSEILQKLAAGATIAEARKHGSMRII